MNVWEWVVVFALGAVWVCAAVLYLWITAVIKKKEEEGMRHLVSYVLDDFVELVKEKGIPEGFEYVSHEWINDETCEFEIKPKPIKEKRSLQDLISRPLHDPNQVYGNLPKNETNNLD